MERAYSEEISNLIWPPSSSSEEQKMMNRSSSEWTFQRFLQENLPESTSPKIASNADASDRVCEVANDNADVKPSSSIDEVSEIKVTLADPPKISRTNNGRLSSVPEDTEQYHEYLKQQLDLACAAAAVVLSRVR